MARSSGRAAYFQERPGPAREDEKNEGVDARIRGRVDDDRVILNVIVDGKTVAGPLTLDFGKRFSHRKMRVISLPSNYFRSISPIYARQKSRDTRALAISSQANPNRLTRCARGLPLAKSIAPAS